MKPWDGTCGMAAARMDSSTALKGPGGGGWSYEWYGRLHDLGMSGRSRSTRAFDAMLLWMLVLTG